MNTSEFAMRVNSVLVPSNKNHSCVNVNMNPVHIQIHGTKNSNIFFLIACRIENKKFSDISYIASLIDILSYWTIDIQKNRT